MTVDWISSVVATALGCSPCKVKVGLTRTIASCSIDTSYDRLAELAAALGTTDINFVYSEGEDGYSSWTPGTSASFEISIGIGAAS